MKIVIFGATGRTGLPLVQQALDAGHDVTAFLRDPARLALNHPHLTPVAGDVMDANAVNKAITADADAVVSVLGPAKGSPENMLPTAAANIISAMRGADIDRLLWMTGAGVTFPQDQPRLFDHVIKFALKTISGAILRQSEEAVRLVQNSGLRWTIVRGPMLTDAPHTGNIRVGWVGVDTGPRLARADAADFILRQLNDDSYIHKAPVISN